MTDLGPKARSILDAGRTGDDPTDSDRVRVRSALKRAIAAGGVVGAASAVATSTAAAASSKAAVLTAGLVWKIAAGLVVVGAVVVSVTLSNGPASVGSTAPPSTSAQIAPQQSQALVPGHSEAPSQAATPPVGSVAADETHAAPGLVAPSAAAAPKADSPSASPRSVAPESAPTPSLPSGESSAKTSQPPANTAAVAAVSPAEDPLEAELRRLREAHKALQDEDPNKALALLDENAKVNSGGQLQEERAAARVFALCKAGRVSEGRAAAAAFLLKNPHSPLADRVRGACPSEPVKASP